MSTKVVEVSNQARSELMKIVAQVPLPTIAVIEAILQAAVAAGVSDVHLSPRQAGLEVRFRVDGVMEHILTIAPSNQEQLIARIKVLCGLRTDEHYAAQDGRFSFSVTTTEAIEVRVSIAPIFSGENCVLRLLRSSLDLTLEKLGLTQLEIKQLETAIGNPYGLIIATGPTGSGKTTTLYSLLDKLNTADRTLITIEDPIEYLLPGANQIAVNPRTGLTFENGLRSIVRQDPDIIMVGEVRDSETAKLATTAALTGHIVLTTLHTNDAPSAWSRLVEMGVDRYLVASTISLVVAQRLVRRLCLACKVEEKLPATVQIRLQAWSPEAALGDSHFVAVGCTHCGGSGYRGRVGLYEVCPTSLELQERVMAGVSSRQLRELALLGGMRPLAQAGITYLLRGETSCTEVIKTVYE